MHPVQQYHNLDPLVRLIGPLNETVVLIEGQKFTALIDSGAQLSGISHKLVKKLQLKIHKLETLLNIEGMGRLVFHIWDV